MQFKFLFYYQASDSGNPALKGDTLLEINILDQNDNTPMFEKTAYHVRLSERTFLGDLVSLQKCSVRHKHRHKHKHKTTSISLC